MFAQLVAVVCTPVGLPSAPATRAPEMCEERMVQSTDRDPEFDWASCMVGAQWVLARWKETGEYSSPRFRVAKWKCIPDRNYVLKGSI